MHLGRGRLRWWLAALLVVCCVVVVLVRCISPPTTATVAWVAEYDVQARPPSLIPPGTRIGDTPPPGWTNLVLKSEPRVRPTDRGKLDGLTVRMAAWMGTAFLARVDHGEERGQVRYRLGTVALGLGTKVGDELVIITPDTAKTHGVELNWITRTILTKGYETQGLATLVLHGPTMGLLDTPVWFRCGASNRLIRYRYALLLDAASGRVDVLLWPLDAEGCGRDPMVAALIPPNTIDRAELIPDMRAFNLLGVPSDAAFGVDRLPAHSLEARFGPDLRELSVKTIFTPGEARSLELELRRSLDALVPSPE
jgi:hypothetical protein